MRITKLTAWFLLLYREKPKASKQSYQGLQVSFPHPPEAQTPSQSRCFSTSQDHQLHRTKEASRRPCLCTHLEKSVSVATADLKKLRTCQDTTELCVALSRQCQNNSKKPTLVFLFYYCIAKLHSNRVFDRDSRLELETSQPEAGWLHAHWLQSLSFRYSYRFNK